MKNSLCLYNTPLFQKVHKSAKKSHIFSSLKQYSKSPNYNLLLEYVYSKLDSSNNKILINHKKNNQKKLAQNKKKHYICSRLFSTPLNHS